VEPSILTGTDPEAVEAVNDSRFGLAAAVFSGSLRWAHRVSDAVDVGQVGVNLPTSGWDVQMPSGGFRDSRSAFKEQGVDAVRLYGRTMSVAVAYGE